jgi:hypothetical protein
MWCKYGYRSIAGGLTKGDSSYANSALATTSYAKALASLRQQHAVGVVVALHGEMIWADIFSDTELLTFLDEAGAIVCGEKVSTRQRTQNRNGRRCPAISR